MKYVIWAGDHESPPYSKTALEHEIRLGHVLRSTLAREAHTRLWRPIATMLGPQSTSSSQELIGRYYVVWEEHHESPPLSRKQLEDSLHRGTVHLGSLVRHADSSDWQLLSELLDADKNAAENQPSQTSSEKTTNSRSKLLCSQIPRLYKSKVARVVSLCALLIATFAAGWWLGLRRNADVIFRTSQEATKPEKLVPSKIRSWNIRKSLDFRLPSLRRLGPPQSYGGRLNLESSVVAPTEESPQPSLLDIREFVAGPFHFKLQGTVTGKNVGIYDVFSNGTQPELLDSVIAELRGNAFTASSNRGSQYDGTIYLGDRKISLTVQQPNTPSTSPAQIGHIFSAEEIAAEQLAKKSLAPLTTATPETVAHSSVAAPTTTPTASVHKQDEAAQPIIASDASGLLDSSYQQVAKTLGDVDPPLEQKMPDGTLFEQTGRWRPPYMEHMFFAGGGLKMIIIGKYSGLTDLDRRQLFAEFGGGKHWNMQKLNHYVRSDGRVHIVFLQKSGPGRPGMCIYSQSTPISLIRAPALDGELEH